VAVTTVIIPAGPKHVHLMARAVESARAQTVPTEVLTFVDTERRGPAYGRNLLASQVTTPFLTLLDADDYLEPNFVEETLNAWVPGSYVTSDWYHGNRRYIGRARWCYPFPSKAGEQNYQLPPSLFPTSFWKVLGGMDETLFGAEDTDFFFKANARLIRSIVVRKPLFTYTDEGFRSKEAAANADWMDLVKSIYKRYRGEFAMGCCGDPAEQSLFSNVSTGDLTLVVRPTFAGAQLYIGRTTGYKYGRISKSQLVYIHPQDFDARDFTKVEDWEGLSPTPEQIAQARAQTVKQPEKAQPRREMDLSDPVDLEELIRQAGVREWRADSNHVKHGYDMQQTPSELAQLLALAQERDVKRVLEIGTGESAGLARFMVEVMGWEVVSVDKVKPEAGDLFDHRRWAFVKADTQAKKLPKELANIEADMVIIDGGHEFAEAAKDWENFATRAPLVAIHDIAPDGWWGGDDKSGGFWRSVSRGPKGGMKKGYSEIIAPLDKSNPMAVEGRQGFGVYTHE
jgi:hypothetical protein